MAASSFGLDAESVRRHHFPNADAFAAGGRPSAATVAEVIDEEAAVMAGALRLQAIIASAITPNSSAYNACRQTLRTQVAARLARMMAGVDSNIAQAWDASVRRWYVGLDEGGDTFLGDGAVSTSASDPDGPTDFITELGLNVGDASEASPIVHTLRTKDML